MKITVVPVCRRPNWPRWAAVLVLLWLGLGAAAAWVGAYSSRPLKICLFKRLTSLPCPTCGFSRGSLCLMHGHILQAWLFNPLLFTVLAIFAAATMLRFIWRRSLKINLSDTERMLAWIAAGTLFIANWVYVILRVG